MKEHFTRIFTNVYHIPERLREIDADYFILRNHKKHTFEVHHKKQYQTTYCLTVPYPELDARTLDLVFKTRICNVDKLIAQMDQNNQKLEEENHEIPEEAQIKAKEVVSYLSRHDTREAIEKDAYSTRFV